MTSLFARQIVLCLSRSDGSKATQADGIHAAVIVTAMGEILGVAL
ncbi:hypothetical protein [Alloacidobacterium dinghuense]|nr:hypothetical protein [Alloacidobacterium dinghuense]